MSEKTFIVKMDGDQACDYREFNVWSRFYCSRTDYNTPCGGDLNNRPEWCSLVEHDISVCHEEFKAIGDNLAQEAAKKMGW